MLLNELTDGIEIDLVLLVGEAERRQQARRQGLHAPAARRSDRLAACMVWEEVGEVGELVRPGTAVPVRGRYNVHRASGRRSALPAFAPAVPGSFGPRTSRWVRAPGAQMEAESAS